MSVFSERPCRLMRFLESLMNFYRYRSAGVGPQFLASSSGGLFLRLICGLLVLSSCFTFLSTPLCSTVGYMLALRVTCSRSVSKMLDSLI